MRRTLLLSLGAVATLAACSPDAPTGPARAALPAHPAFRYRSGGTHAGRIFVNDDEWALSDAGFASAPTAAQFARNLGDWFTGGQRGSFLAYSSNFGLTGAQLAQTMRAAGHTWTVGTSQPFTLATLAQYDAVFVGGDVVDPQVLTQYVQQGGNVYVMGGTGVFPVINGEEGIFNPFLNAFGLSFGPQNNVFTTLSLSSTHPTLSGVTSLFHRTGSTVNRLDPNDPNTQIFVPTGPSSGLLAVYEPPNHAPTGVGFGFVGIGLEGEVGQWHGNATDPDGDVLTYTWDFAGQKVGGQNVTHTFIDNRVYPVTLTVSDGWASVSISGTITIQNVAPTVFPQPDRVVLPGTRVFAPDWRDAGQVDFFWTTTLNWGDGTAASVGQTITDGWINIQAPGTPPQFQAPAHVYSRLGTYTVSLAVRDRDGAVGSGGFHVTVLPALPRAGSVPVGIASPTLATSSAVHASSALPVISLSQGGLVTGVIYGGKGTGIISPDMTRFFLGTADDGFIGAVTDPQRCGGACSSVADVNGDGYADFTLHFDPAALFPATLGAPITPTLTLWGTLSNGLVVKGSKKVTVVP